MKLAFPVAAALAVTGCVSLPAGSPNPQEGIARAGLTERVYVDGPYVTPLEILEDSRCPMNVRCVWAGRTRILVRIDLGSRTETREIGSDQPIQVADGQLSLADVQPDRMAGEQSGAEGPYRFGFRFAGGI